MIITTKIQADMLRSGETPVVEAVQDDKYSRNLEITMWAGGVPWEVPAGTKAVIRYMKPDGTGGSYDTLPDGSPACVVSGCVVLAALAPQVCTASGLVRLAVSLIRSGTEVTTFGISLLVHRNPGISAVSEDYTNLTAYVKAFGWKPGMYLSTDESGQVAAVDPRESIGSILDGILKVTSVSVARADDAVTLTAALADGSRSVCEITLDENGYPSGIVTGGAVCPVSWEGF